ncbi:hypothetical protein FGSG_11955 [Fusarium graminearum PH-1]|uniref:Velvet domain-containing protein n=1 Tax=Gibberella zeae (strain ATCC MYA-4620 / CBS 123657 / FGSC 9075 / NRRL 31084 / PH-1) TaxID=229533 RepID=A0A1I9EYT1_GIBZE|nr:hypothetical protein FGSG_11955 [Fusarium graminearum PH-1]I1S537.1 RecName: Full=Developmental and secondary metabolism regulator ve1; AltName: Full=Velvet complex subunit 1 [Fusarium graminearum PH-1]ESU06761.1 hypothetical protein FGSG_11955 [Fusarium graminearum PH-1]|eukprot:XP_011317246.1 hypothetical protein FGSG_11955 [Fusarium graminearum PH-1]
MATPSAIPTNSKRDTTAQFHRVTRGNRSLWYQLTVLQQPERARACGSGMKANSDRRPVDPPPVVELRIVEGPTLEEGKDVTFDYNANFFLYASLEHARPIASCRVSTPTTNNPPILTGVPASGMAYLDRPSEAGYFIFPDLSVRHEGLYRLTFSLFETTKEEQDFDIQPADGDLPPGVDFRMEIKTDPFSVFSAKKFPGLMESTQLSKTVADQGCRVRIRRDVRMRKRDTKSGGNNNNNNNAGNNAGNNGFERREEDFGRRRTSTSTYVPPSPSVYSTEGHYRRDSQASYPPTPAAAPLPRMNTEPSRGSIKISALVEPMPVIEPQVDPLPELPPVNVGGKRKHESVFAQNTRPLFNGQRQMDPHYGRSHRGYSPDHDQGSYSRADGQISVIQFNKYEY